MPDIRIVKENGAPALMVNGVRTLPILYQLSDIPGSSSNTAQAQRNIKNFGEIGINLVGVDTGLHLGWHKVTPFDAEAMLEEIAAAVDANPNAKVLVRLHVNPPYWWRRDNPDECVVYRTPQGDLPGIDDGESDRLIRDDGNRHLRASIASEKWLAEASEKLALFCDALKASPLYGSMLAIQIANGIYGEWHQWGVDVSKPMKARFTRLLREKYGTDEALAKAWDQPGVTFETAEYHPETFRPGDVGHFRDPRLSRFVADAQECNQSSVSDAILHFCHIVKERLPGVLAGSFYGYYHGTGGDNMTINGHLMIDRLYASPDVDFLCGPFCYMNNRKPEGFPLQRALLESARLHGKLWLTEMDQHPAGTEKYHGGDPALFDETVYMLRRNTFQTLVAGQGFWYYDHRIIPSLMPPDTKNSTAGSIYRKRGWWDTPELMRTIRDVSRVSEAYTLGAYKPAADVLFVYDTTSFYHRAKVYDREYSLHESVVRCGAVYDDLYLDDLPLAETDRYKCVIFANCFTITPERRAELQQQLAGKTVVWLYCQGFCDGETLSDENVSETAGMKLVRSGAHTSFTTASPLPVRTVPIGEGLYDPYFACTDEDAEVLARYENGECAAAVKRNNVWFGAPILSADLLCPILERAGVHRYTTSPDPILAGNGLCIINSLKGGRRELRFPNGVTVTHVLPPLTTAVFDSETGERLL